MQKLYEILGAPLGSSKPELKKKYHALALKHHPDKGGDQEKFKEVTLAYEILSGKRKPNRHETAKYADPVAHQPGPARPTSQPQPYKTTVWPPEHYKEYQKQGRPKQRAEWKPRPVREEHRPKPRSYNPQPYVPKHCTGCGGSGKSKRSCTSCFGTGNIVGSTHPAPSAVRKCPLCIHGMQEVGECQTCKGTGKYVK